MIEEGGRQESLMKEKRRLEEKMTVGGRERGERRGRESTEREGGQTRKRKGGLDRSGKRE